ncbi:MAG: HlyC/CorC family transporter [bacterium]|nr:HlyC/CorC family transporter [bacterium]
MDFLILVLLALALSAYFSAMEISYTTFDAIIIGGWKKAHRFGTRFAEFLSSVPERYLFTTLVGNNLVMVAYSSFLVIWAEREQIAEGWIVVLSPLVVLVIGEVIPKTLGLAFANPFVRFLSLPLYIFYWLFVPVRALVVPLEKLLRGKGDTSERAAHAYDVLFRREIDAVLARASKEGTVTEKESEILDRYLHAREVRARDMMTPRLSLVALPMTASIQDLTDLLEDTHHSVIPVYEDTIDNIVGFLHSRDLLQSRESIREFLRPASFVPESKLLVELLEQFKNQRLSAAIVVDEHGGTDGIVTQKDLFRELVGPLRESEEATIVGSIKRLAEGKYLVSALADLSDIAEATGWRPPDGDYATLSGLLSEHLGHIGRPGEEIEIDGVIIRILGSTPRRVVSCLVRLPPDFDPEG